MEIGKIEIVSSCGLWKQVDRCEWEFIVDYERGGSCCDVEENISFDQLIQIIHEDFAVDRLKSVIKLSYCLPSAATLKQGSTPPMYIRNDRQLRSFINKLKGGSEKMLLCVQVIETEPGETSVSDIHPEISGISCQQTEASSTAEKESEAVPLTSSPLESPVSGKDYAYKINPQAFDIYIGRSFSSKEELVLKMKHWAIEWNFEYKTARSDSYRVKLRCVDSTCFWKMSAYRMKSGYFGIKKYDHRHTCDTTLRKPNHRQASVKTLSNMICGNYSEKKDGLKPKQIISQMKEHYGVHINYKKAWRAKGAAEDLVRGTHEESYINLAKWLYVAKERNPGTVTYLQSSEGKFKYSFLAFGASIRGFRLMRRVIAVDGTFLKGKFKGTLLCATAQDGDYHLYPLAFAIVDSENNESWNWFMR